MISVAIATYNGQEFIKEQLLSILNQTMPVDEIMICDDQSSDDTVRIIQELLGHENLQTTEIYSHLTNKKIEDDYQNHPHANN